jgi:hypothetical protein
MEDFKEVAYFTVSLIVAAFIITLVVTLGGTAGQMASIRNGELMTADTLQLARKFSAYNNQTVMGCDVIALLRENAVADDTLDIYVERNNMNVSMTMSNSNKTESVWKLSNLTQRINPNAMYHAVLVYGGENPATAIYSPTPGGEVTGIKFMVG